MTSNPQTIQEIGAPANRWQPEVGPETCALLERLKNLDEPAKQSLLSQSVAILAKCVPPGAGSETDTGLVIGYVQSGKTMSFTAVTALARDNGIRLIVVLTGISTTLDDQSAERLRRELRLDDPLDRRWLHYDNPKKTQAIELQNELINWDDPEVPAGQRKTILLTAMKNVIHLRNLSDVLGRLNLRDVTALVIDDEADQAGLNIQVNNQLESTTYSRILSVRHNLPRHTYLQYTATPQAPLLITLIDMLSPRFAELLTPGDGYVGGDTFFKQRRDLVVTIPNNELPTATAAPPDVPDSLLEAMRLFFLGVASAFAQNAIKGNRSMMVHPARTKGVHRQYYIWVTRIIHSWAELLAMPDSEPDKQELVKEFQTSYNALRKTVAELPPFADLLRKLPYAIRSTKSHEVNTNNTQLKTVKIDWARQYSHILVGGQAMDRGFTVEGLTVTYMPRSLARSPNADTVQQRARFFGYKKSYLDYCRVFLDAGHREAYRSYVEHEADVRKRLQAHNRTGKPLTMWARAFFLDLTYRATRSEVLSLDYMQSTVKDKYFYQKAPHLANLAHNRDLVTRFKATINWMDDPRNAGWTPNQSHNYAYNVKLQHVLDSLLVDYSLRYPDDSHRFTGLKLQIKRYLEGHEDEPTCTLIDIGGGKTRRRRGLNGGLIPSLFEGKAGSYPGDEHVCDDPGIKIQFYCFDLHEQGKTVEDNVPLLAIFLPSEVSGEWWVQ